MKKLAISILNRNGIEDTIQCIDSLLESDFCDFDIYLLDNGSKNNELKKLQNEYNFNKNILLNKSEKNLGFVGGNNFNLELIKKNNYNFVLLLNNDTIIPKNFLGEFVKKSENIKDGSIFGPLVKEFYDQNIIQSCGNFLNMYAGTSKRLKELNTDFLQVDYVTGACFMFKFELLDKVGLLDEDYFAYREESDYCVRAKKLGFKTYVINNIWIYHKEESANRKIKPYYTYLMFRNRILFLKKNANTLQYLISYIFLVGYLLILFPKIFGIKNYKYAFEGIFDGINDKFKTANIL